MRTSAPSLSLIFLALSLAQPFLAGHLEKWQRTNSSVVGYGLRLTTRWFETHMRTGYWFNKTFSHSNISQRSFIYVFSELIIFPKGDWTNINKGSRSHISLSAMCPMPLYLIYLFFIYFFLQCPHLYICIVCMYIWLNCIYLYLNVYCQCLMLTVCTKGLRVTQFQFSVCMYCTCGRIDNKTDLTTACRSDQLLISFQPHWELMIDRYWFFITDTDYLYVYVPDMQNRYLFTVIKYINNRVK